MQWPPDRDPRAGGALAAVGRDAAPFAPFPPDTDDGETDQAEAEPC